MRPSTSSPPHTPHCPHHTAHTTLGFPKSAIGIKQQNGHDRGKHGERDGRDDLSPPPPPPSSFDQARASRPFFQRYGGTGGRAAVCPVGLRATVPVPRWYFCQPLASRPSRPATGLGNHRWYRGDRDDGAVERGFALLCSARKCISSSPPNKGARICGPSPPYTKGWCLALAYLIICGRASFSPPSPPCPCSQQLSASGAQKAQQALSTASRHSTPAVWMRYLGGLGT